MIWARKYTEALSRNKNRGLFIWVILLEIWMLCLINCPIFILLSESKSAVIQKKNKLFANLPVKPFLFPSQQHWILTPTRITSCNPYIVPSCVTGPSISSQCFAWFIHLTNICSLPGTGQGTEVTEVNKIDTTADFMELIWGKTVQAEERISAKALRQKWLRCFWDTKRKLVWL